MKDAKFKRIMASSMAGAMALSMSVTPALAASTSQGAASNAANPVVTKDTVDMTKTGSITLFKLVENEGSTSEGNAQINPDEDRAGLPNIVFTTKKIADFVNIAQDGQVGIYFTNLDPDFVTALKKAGVADSLVTSGTISEDSKAAQSYKGLPFYTTAQLEAAMSALNAAPGDGSTYTGETVAEDYIKAAPSSASAANTNTYGTSHEKIEFAKTDAKGATHIDGMDLGLYMIVETGYVDGEGNYVYRSKTWDQAGVETYDASKADPSNDDYNFHDDTSKENAYSESEDGQDVQDWNKINNAEDKEDRKAADGNQNPVVIDNPTDPFLVSVPTTNMAVITKDGVTYEPGTVWQYDITVYPKNSLTTITKKVVADDGNKLVERQDYHIGQNIHEVIYSDVPVTMWNRTNAKYAVTDTMSDGLTFQKVTKVALMTKANDIDELTDFNSAVELEADDYVITYKDASNADITDTLKAYNADASLQGDAAVADVKYGTQDIHSFTVTLTEKGLAKLDKLTVESQLIVEFDTVLNKDAIIGSADGKTFNVNYPTLNWRNSNTLEREVQGNEVKVFTYELDLTKTGADTRGTQNVNGNTIDDDHEFDAADVSFTIMQKKQYDPKADESGANIVTEDQYMRFVKEADGVYHVWTPADGAIKSVVKQDTLKDSEGKYAATTVNASGAVDVYEIVSPSASTTDGDGNVESGKLIIKGLDSETYTFTEKSTSGSFNLLKSSFDVKLNSQGFAEEIADKSYIQDGTLLANPEAEATVATVNNYGATATTDDNAMKLAHEAGIVSMTVNNYKTITLHTGARTAMIMYICAGGALMMTVLLAAKNKKKGIA